MCIMCVNVPIFECLIIFPEQIAQGILFTTFLLRCIVWVDNHWLRFAHEFVVQLARAV